VLRIEEMRRWAHANNFALRLAIFYIAVFFIIGCYMPYLPVWLKARGLGDGQLALIYALPLIMRPAFTPAISYAVDHYGHPRLILKLLAWGTFLAAVALSFTNSFIAIFTVFFILAVFWMAILPLTEAIALAGMHAGHSDYGRVRLWGSISFIVMTVAGGAIVAAWGPTAALVLFIGAAASVVVAAQWLPNPDTHKLATDDAPLPALRFADFLQLVRARELWLLFAATSAVQAAHSVYYVFGTLHWEAIHISPIIIGLLWAVGVIAEITLFAHAGRIVQHIGAVQLILIAGAAGILRWTVTAFDPPLAVLFVIQTLHGLTYGAAHIGTIQFLQQAVPRQLSASAQGLYASVPLGVAMGLISLVTGSLHRSLDGYAYLVMAGLCVLSVLAGWRLYLRWDGQTLVLTPTEQELAAERTPSNT
jgi:MFS transporter, PPP family, 3-phenylpropionic acid transporter